MGENMGDKKIQIAVLDVALSELEAVIRAEPTDAYSRFMAQLSSKHTAYIPTDAEQQKLKVIESVRHRLEAERGEFVQEAVIADEMSSGGRAVLIEALQRRVMILMRGRGFPDDILKAISNHDDFTPITRADYLAYEEDTLRRLQALQAGEPEYLLEWARSTNGKKHGVWKKLFMSQAFRDDVIAMAKEQEKMAPVLKAYWDKHKTLQGKGSFDSFRKGFGDYPRCREMFPK